MASSKLIQVFEYSRIQVGQEFEYKEHKFKFNANHLKALATYLTANEGCGYYSLLYNGVRFHQYVGVIQVDGLTIEVLPKTEKHTTLKEKDWQKILIDMLRISLHVEAKTTTVAAININKLNVLDAYLLLFLEEVQSLMHSGLVKKYRKIQCNQNALKGRLLFGKHISKNLVHAERFYVEHTTYDRNNTYNAILYKALNTIANLSVSNIIRSKCNTILLDFPECDDLSISSSLFDRLNYDRKTSAYRKGIELAKIILMNYHPDFKGGKNNILAIMVDMNELWENYIYFVLRKAADKDVNVYPQQWESFWKPDNGNYRTIRPDIVIEDKIRGKSIVLDTKWKYQSKTSVEDVRQMYAYGHYFKAVNSYLVYPDQVFNDDKIEVKKGRFNKAKAVSMDNQSCGLLWIDLIKDGKLNKDIGSSILRHIEMQPNPQKKILPTEK